MNQCKTCGIETKNNIYCSNTCKTSDPDWKKNRIRKHKHPDTENELHCNICNWKTKDVNNLGGYATKHLRVEHGIHTTSYDSYYTIKPKPKTAKLQCPYCDWTTVDIHNKSGKFTTHLMNAHEKTPHDTYTEYPQYESLWLRFKDKQEKIDADPIECQICSKSMEKLSNTHLELHGLTMTQYKEKFPYAPVINTRLSQLHSEYSKEHNATREYTYRSKAEQEIENFLRGLDVPVMCNDKRFGIELDLLLPSHAIAIEYNGLRWHSEFFGKKDKQYHINKTIKCQKHGIRLIHIFEDEWTKNAELVKSKLMHILGKTTTKIYARKCEVRVLTAKESAAFCNQYHIQGTGKGYLHIGLFLETELVACMQLSKLRKSLNQTATPGHVEISRYCTKYAVIGGFSKLLNAATKFDANIQTIISYADKRWTPPTRNMYTQAGFELVRDNGPNYWYTRGNTRMHRYNFTKSRIVAAGGNPNLSEIQNMQQLGYDRIWDCGTLKYAIQTSTS